MELLAPAGNLENFRAALDAGADGVYVGAPGFNARNLARDLRLEEIGAMVRHCHDRGKKLYIAANSLILEKEFPAVIEALALLETLEPDALIVQDLGLIRLVREHFPSLTLHASTLMTAHNADAVRILSSMGCKRVVLARELTLKEIAAIAAGADTELEVFVHGAMCFSYSGLCLFSSYLGGKSGLRGRCVQPCRRAYHWQGRSGKGGGRAAKDGYLFSMNDLSGLDVVPELRRMGIASLKIEGRLRSAHYVSHVVRAYRMVFDAAEADFLEAVNEAKILVERAMGRTVSPGFFLSPQPKEAISPQHSGNTGLHLGSLKTLVQHESGLYGVVNLKESVELGDRLRLHFESSGERRAFSLKGLRVRNRKVDRTETAGTAWILLPDGIEHEAKGRIELYKIDVHAETGDTISQDLEIGAVKRELAKNRERLRRCIEAIQSRVRGLEDRDHVADGSASRGRARKAGTQKKGDGLPVEWWLKTDSLKVVMSKLPFVPDRLLLTLDKNMAGEAGRIRQYLGQQARNVIWALPPVLLGAELGRMRSGIASLIRSGFKSFQIGHLSQVVLFGNERVHLFGDYTLNLVNDQAVMFAAKAGLEGVQVSIEMDHDSMKDLFRAYQNSSGVLNVKGRRTDPKISLGLTVYGAPALFTARLAAGHFQYDRIFVSPKGESFNIRKKEGGTQTFPCRPFSLLPYLEDLKQMGLQYAVVDISGLTMDRKGLQELADRMADKGRFTRLPTFNYLGKLE
jgi:U32 family peptidase